MTRMSTKHLVLRSAAAGLGPAIVYPVMQAFYRKGSEVGNITLGLLAGVFVAIVCFLVFKRGEDRTP